MFFLSITNYQCPNFNFQNQYIISLTDGRSQTKANKKAIAAAAAAVAASVEAFVSLGNLYCFCLFWAPFGFECSAPVIRQEFDPGREEWEIDKAEAFGRTHD